MKPTIAVIFGGVSSEHDVSCMSVQNVVSNIDTELYDFVLIGITKEGEWLLVDSIDKIRGNTWRDSKVKATISPDAVDKCIIIEAPDGITKRHIDVVYPVLHGIGGEDGTIQGLCELAKIPYVGCGVLASSVTMDKTYTKIIVDSLGIRQADYVLVLSYNFEKNKDSYVKEIETKLGYPVFVKPSNGGSSLGVTRADNREELIAGLTEAAKYDYKILVEEMIYGREVECAVIGGGRFETKAGGVGEILAAAEFYDFDAKYNNPESKTVVDPDMPEEAKKELCESAIRIFDAVDGYGLSRVDFFYDVNGKVVFSEINTIPGFTAISMWPMIWEAAGLSKKDQVQKLIRLALERN